MNEHQRQHCEDESIARDRRQENEDRMREGPTDGEALQQIGWNGDSHLFMSLNLDRPQLLAIQTALDEFEADDERSIETKLGQICREWKAHRVDRDTPLTGHDLPITEPA